MAIFEEATSLSQDHVAHRPKPLLFLILLAWCGLVSGLLEVGVIILRKQLLDFNRLYWMSRHFVWIIPLINLFVFLMRWHHVVLVGLALVASRPLARHSRSYAC